MPQFREPYANASPFQRETYFAHYKAIQKAQSIKQLEIVALQIIQHYMQWSQGTDARDLSNLLHLAARKCWRLQKAEGREEVDG